VVRGVVRLVVWSGATAGHRGDVGLVLLDAGRVRQHDRDQVAGRRRTVDRALEALANQVGQVAAVIDVGVTEDDGVDGGRVEGEVADWQARRLARAAAARGPDEQKPARKQPGPKERTAHRTRRA